MVIFNHLLATVVLKGGDGKQKARCGDSRFRLLSVMRSHHSALRNLRVNQDLTLLIPSVAKNPRLILVQTSRACLRKIFKGRRASQHLSLTTFLIPMIFPPKNVYPGSNLYFHPSGSYPSFHSRLINTAPSPAFSQVKKTRPNSRLHLRHLPSASLSKRYPNNSRPFRGR